ncbi:hypothetical protein PTSG_11642 [Salpingoeca rosetta]|uniref:Uncharacterized protein n=1 Tax=Salpingoeca rosetta (strain ATCC 50818 / BSB-021) TaxID=946362 RepID=F2TXG2_SALR5|nr:uncharacterized protein PTSG_11642 [Salpingoeca rosetta]EGD76071.1 hypothetical protein PTSG_11642 [Salpingoeca rosetta]|eukprot:XP_004998246.1 hypothetical protein PTSG_11642 [Salpingoeca rosetta]
MDQPRPPQLNKQEVTAFFTAQCNAMNKSELLQTWTPKRDLLPQTGPGFDPSVLAD